MSGIALVRCTFADRDEAQRIARQLVEERLAACVTLHGPALSVYRWQSAVEEAVEVVAVFKTGADCVPMLCARLRALHSYDLPAIAVIAADAAPDVTQWVAAATDPRP